MAEAKPYTISKQVVWDYQNGFAAVSPTQRTGWVRWHDAILNCWFCGSWGYDRRLDHKSRMR